VSGRVQEEKSPSGQERNKLEIALFVLAICAFIAFCILLILGTWTRTFLVEARSFGATLVLQGETNNWDLESAVLCQALKAPAIQVEEGGMCPGVIFSVSEARPRTISWPAGATLGVRLQPDDSLQIEALSGADPVLADGDRFVVPAENWRRHGALVVNGAVILGSDMASGARDYLISGRWEARQDSAASTRPSMEVVRSGDFSRGASVEIRQGKWLFGLFGKQQRATVFGHLTPSLDPNSSGFIMSFLSETGRLEMHLRYFGLEHPAIVRPDFLDTILTSPIMLALATVLGVLVLLLEIASNMRGEVGNKVPWLVSLKKVISKRDGRR
jgi:hypothetical protein